MHKDELFAMCMVIIDCQFGGVGTFLGVWVGGVVSVIVEIVVLVVTMHTHGAAIALLFE